MKAFLRGTRISAKKMNLIAGLVRTKSVTDALDILKFTYKKGADTLRKVVKSAASNAEKNFDQDVKKLIVKEILVSDGPPLKRFRPVSKGRSHPILKRTCHVTVTVETK